MAGCSPSACSTCPWREIEEQMKKKIKEQAKKPKAEKA